MESNPSLSLTLRLVWATGTDFSDRRCVGRDGMVSKLESLESGVLPCVEQMLVSFMV